MTEEALTPKNEILAELIWDEIGTIQKGAASRTADRILEEFILIPKADLPKTTINDKSSVEVEGVDHSMWPVSRATADRARRDALDYWAAAEAIEAALPTRELEAEAHALYVTSCLATGTDPAPNWKAAIELPFVEKDFLAIARTARKLHGKEPK